MGSGVGSGEMEGNLISTCRLMRGSVALFQMFVMSDVAFLTWELYFWRDFDHGKLLVIRWEDLMSSS